MKSSVVYQEVANDFTNNNQCIKDRPIMSVVYGPMPAPDSAITPDRFGMMYVQILEGTQDKKTHVWISVNNGPASSFIWEEVYAGSELPKTVAKTDESNDFQPYDQKISGKQILSFVDGGTQTPEQSKLGADYDGQFYLAVRTLSDGKKDVAVWVASGNQWLPLSSGGSIDTSKLAKLDVKNEFEALNYFKESTFFEHNTNFIGDLADGRQMIGCRAKPPGLSPAADSSWVPAMEGELCIFQNLVSGKLETSLWVATDANPMASSTQWKQIYPAGGGSGEEFTPTDFIDNYSEQDSDIKAGIGSDGKLTLNTELDRDHIAFTDKANTFVPFQKLGGDGNECFISGARTGFLAPKGVVLPLTFGEVYIRQIVGSDDSEIWLATQEADTDSWIQLYDSVFEDFVKNKFTTLEELIDILKSDVKELEDGIAEISADVAKEVSDLDDKVTQEISDVKDRVKAAEDLVNGFDNEIQSLKSVDQDFKIRIEDLEDHRGDVNARIDDLSVKIDNDRDGMNQVVNEAVAELEKADKVLEGGIDHLSEIVVRLEDDFITLQTEVEGHTSLLSSIEEQLVQIRFRLDALETSGP